MEWYDIEVDGRQTTKFADNINLPLLRSPSLSPGEEEHVVDKKLGGIIRRGEWAWLARNTVLQIVSLRNGQTISTYEFCQSRGYDNCCIRCVEELFPHNPEIMIVAVILENFHVPSGGGSYVVLYSIELGCVLSTIELVLHSTCARFLSSKACKRTLLQNFDGCLAIGTEEGVIVLLDLNMNKINRMECEIQDGAFNRSHIVDYSLPLTDIHRNYRQCQQDGITFGLQLEVIESPCSIQCIQSIDLITGLAIGLEDGRLALYDLAELQIFHIARPTAEIAMSPLVKIDYLEPPDDPRACLYVWTLHENGENLHAIMHNLMYEKRVMDEQHDELEGQYYFESFLSSNVRLQLPLEATRSEALACQAISTLCSHGEDDSNCLCVISWHSVYEGKNKLLIFDLNQWYKEEMPLALEYGQQPSYLAGYILNGECNGLHAYLQPNSITHFNSMQRFEEHFYPNSLSFECTLLHTEGSRRYSWEGAQNRLINLLRVSNASIFLEPNNCFNEILRTRLMPQFTELNLNSTFSQQAKYEIMLSTALENNCVSLLRDCAKSWIDGSFMGDFAVSTGLSLSTLTDWIWKRATDIKARCNDLCKGLFEFGGYPLDHREQKELCFITRQLKLLHDLLGETLVVARKQIPERVYSSLENNHNSLRMASNYQELLLWLLNIGLLPEASPFNSQVNAHHDLVPYPYQDLKKFYKKKRLYFSKINDNLISKKTGSCRLLYIDAFIDHACKGNVLHEFWLENDGDGLYPPNSIEAMLRVMLVPDLDYENKYAILLYFFLDMNMAIDEEAYKGVVANFIKFPSVFKLSAALIKTVQSFWNLDHDQFLPAVEEFISPFNKNQSYPQWLVELLIESLLTQNSANLALRILESQPALIAPMLKLKTLLANQLISEAFHFVRSKNDESLLEIFFTCCLHSGQFGVIRDLALSENEGMILQNILKRSKAPGAESLHFVYLLQKSKYIEAVSYMDELSARPKSLRSSLHNGAAQMETPNMVLSAFNTTMTPVTQGLTDVYFRIKNKIKKKDVDNKSPVPLSCQLIKQNANSLLGGVYHSSALSAHFATYYWGEMEEEQKRNGAKHLLSSNNAPFLRRPQNETNYIDFMAKNNVSYPQAYKVREKRNLGESELLANDEERQKLENQLNPKKKRRLVGQELVQDLTQFMQMNKQKSIQLNGSDFRFLEKPMAANEGQEKVQHASKAMEILTQPLKTKASQRGTEDVQHRGSPTEIHGILKSHMTETGAVATHEEEKNLRFRLPSTELSNSLMQNIAEEENEEMDMGEENVSEEPMVEIYSRLKAKKASRSISVDSNKSSVSSSNASEDNFYSPLSSHNNSKLDNSTLSKCSFTSGPKARRPISRLSAEMNQESKGEFAKRLSGEREIARPRSRLSARFENYEEEQSKEVLSTAAVCHAKEDTKEPCKDYESLESSKDVSIAQDYVTAPSASNMGLTISARKSLASVSKTMETTENVSHNLAYVTAFDKLSHLATKTDNATSQTSSGFGSISASSTITSGSQFIPKVSSSKVGSTPGKVGTTEEAKPTTSGPNNKLSQSSTVFDSYDSNVFAMPSRPVEADARPLEEKKPPQSPAKLAECSTVLGSFEYTSSSVGSQNMFAMPSALASHKNEAITKPTEEQRKHMLDTTLGMSTYDFSVLDATSVQQTKSLLMVTAHDKEMSEKAEVNSKSPLAAAESSGKEKHSEEKAEITKQEPRKAQVSATQTVNVKDLEFSEKPKPVEQQQMEGVGEQKTEDKHNDSKEEEQQSAEDGENKPKRVWADLLYSSDEEDCIVLSSSSSYIDDNDYGRPFEIREIDRECVHEGEHGDIASERSFDTGEYEDYADDDMGDDYEYGDDDDGDDNETGEEEEGDDDGNDEESMDLYDNDNGSNQNSDIVEVIDDSSADTRQTANYPEESASKDVKLVEEYSSGNSRNENLDEHVVSNTHNSDATQATNDKSLRPQMDKSNDKPIVVTSAEEEPTEQPSISKTSAKVAAITKVEVTEETAAQIISESPENQAQETKVDAKSGESSKTSSVAAKETVEEHKKFLQDAETAKISDSAEEEQITLRIEEGDSMDVAEALEIVDSQKPEEVTLNEQTMGKGKRTRKASTSKALDSSSTAAAAITSSRRNARGISVPPLDLQSTPVASPRRSTRGISVPPEDVVIEPKPATTSRRSIRATSVTPADLEASTNKSSEISSSSRRNARGSSVPPQAMEAAELVVSSPRLRSTRGISVPPQSVGDAEPSPSTPLRRRGVRATSLQPKYKIDEEVVVGGEHEDTPTTNKKGKMLDSANSDTRSTRGSSVPPGKVSTRRRSIMLDAINEDSTTIADSPAAHTRLRSRLHSNDSELETSLVHEQPAALKRSRRTSLSGNTAELPLTPKLGRRNSTSSQPETNVATPTRSLRGRSILSVAEEEIESKPETSVGTPRALRGRSILSVPEEEGESIPPSPKPAENKRKIAAKRKVSAEDHPEEEKKEAKHKGEDAEASSSKKHGSPQSTESSDSTYSSSRRLTRTQLAIMEKSSGLTQSANVDSLSKDDSPNNNKRSRARPRSAATNTSHDSDDAESVSSKRSTASSATAAKRRITRKSVKDKEEREDDRASVASSLGSEKNTRSRRSKDKGSPNSVLSAIPEDAPVESRKRGRPSAKQ
ncbi:protein ELYS homolog [Stomoxys calcitrans]|uniref:protein ELYS homolog n=1 Tax=Stomoxys calcitrans TaxID=35570 RepID=UPI0027E2714A|nr:protein ELYS homolog [Stomoxys calcitrans]